MGNGLPIRITWAVSMLLLAAPLLLRVFLLVTEPASEVRRICEFIYDDGYYYLSVAANVADFGRSTLDGVTATNGYQPLWLLVLVGVAKLVGTQTHTLFFACCTLIYTIACAVPLLALWWRRSALRYAALALGAGLAMVMIQQPIVFLEGLEPILLAPAVMVLVMSIERGSLERASLVQVSALLAVLFLVRLDMLSLYIATMIFLPLFAVSSGATSRRELPALTLRVAACLSLFVLPTALIYAALNQHLFGTPVPVSGLAKAIGGPPFSNWGAISIFFRRSFGLLIVLLLSLEVLTRRLALRPEATFYRSIAIVTAAIAMQCIYYADFSSWYLWPWYASLVAIDMALLVARVIYLTSLCYEKRRWAAPGVGVLVLLVAWAAYRSLIYTTASVPEEWQSRLDLLHRFGTGAKQPTPVTSFNQLSMDMLPGFVTPGSRTLIAMGDRAGGLAYWGREQLSVMQTEGLMLDVDYIRARRAGLGARYLERFPIRYYVVDREALPMVTDSEGHTQLYVVADPIQGRITIEPVPTFCFAANALRYRKSYDSVYGRNTRWVFEFANRVPCTVEAMAKIRAIERGVGLRQYSLPGEYDPASGGPMDKRAEDRDRRRVLSSERDGG